MGALRSELAALQERVTELQAKLQAQPVSTMHEQKKSTRRPRRASTLHAVDAGEPAPAKPATRKQSTAEKPLRSRPVKATSSWDISSIVGSDSKVTPIRKPGSEN
ncbi:MAG: hypothetical protein U1F34_03315 [Gammaproteobacteria bacterium]